MLGASALEVAAVSATCLAALAGAVGAGAAWRAAVASKRTSRDALAALAVAIKPGLDVNISDPPSATGGEWFARIRAGIEWEALDVDVEVYLGDGGKLTERADRLGRTATRRELEIGLGTFPADTARSDVVSQVVTRYRDSRRIARYLRRDTFTFRVNPQTGTRVHDWSTSEEQIEGPRAGHE